MNACRGFPEGLESLEGSWVLSKGVIKSDDIIKSVLQGGGEQLAGRGWAAVWGGKKEGKPGPGGGQGDREKGREV